MDRLLHNPNGLWNSLASDERGTPRGASLGHQIEDGVITRRIFRLSDTARTEHISILGKTGSGKTSLIKHLISQDIFSDRGFCVIDLHGDLTPYVLSQIVRREQKDNLDLSAKLIIFDPSDRKYSVGLNLLQTCGRNISAVVSEFASLLKEKWQLGYFGARPEELLRNSLWVLAEAGQTLLELSTFLTNSYFRSKL